MSTAGSLATQKDYAMTEGIMWFLRGKCILCGKLTPPVFADINKDHMEALGRLRDMLQSTKWWVDVYRVFSGSSPGIKVICRCPICDKTTQQLRTKGRQEIATIVTSMDESQVETMKGLT